MTPQTLQARARRLLPPADDTPAPTPSAAYQALRLLAYLRVFTPLSQAMTLLVVTQSYSVQVPLGGVGVVLALEVLVAAATFVRLRGRPAVSQPELFGQAMLDVGLFAAMLYLTGGAENPFAPLFLVPMVIVASALESVWVWAMAFVTIVAYALLRHFNVPMSHPGGHTQVYALHEDGMVINYFFTAALLAFFLNRLHAALRRNERRLTDARDAQMRNESVVAIGALAAGYAHELSSPLATVMVVTAEMKRMHAADDQMLRDLQVIEEEIGACKRIVSNLASAGGQRRAEAAGGQRIDHFLAAAIDRARALFPGATITARIDGPQPAPTIVAEETLRQAIVNLVQNAAQASPEHVGVEAGWCSSELRVEVTDRGPGFAPDILDRLGQRIESTKGADGMGLGLLLSMATLERLGGQLDVANLPDGAGARATIRVPLKRILIDPNRLPANGYAPV